MCGVIHMQKASVPSFSPEVGITYMHIYLYNSPFFFVCNGNGTKRLLCSVTLLLMGGKLWFCSLLCNRVVDKVNYLKQLYCGQLCKIII